MSPKKIAWIVAGIIIVGIIVTTVTGLLPTWIEQVWDGVWGWIEGQFF